MLAQFKTPAPTSVAAPSAPVVGAVAPQSPVPTVSREDMQWAVQLEERNKRGYRPSSAEDARYNAIVAA